MNRETLEKQIIAFIQKKHPKALEQFNLTIKGKNDFVLNENDVADLVFCCYKAYFHTPHPTAFTNLYNPVRQLARGFGEYALVKELEELYLGKKLAKQFHKPDFVPLSIVEQIVYRDTAVIGFRVVKKYAQIRGGVWRLGELIQLLSLARSKVFDIFQDIKVANNIQTPSYALQDFKSSQQNLGMPELK